MESKKKSQKVSHLKKLINKVLTSYKNLNEKLYLFKL